MSRGNKKNRLSIENIRVSHTADSKISESMIFVQGLQRGWLLPVKHEVVVVINRSTRG